MIKTEAFKLLRALNGKITYSSLKRYLGSVGYVLTEYSLTDDDVILKAYGIQDMCKGCDGKTFCGNNIHVVAIKKSLSPDDKIRVIIHEIGHIVLHFKDIDVFTDSSTIQRDNEAEAFVHEVLKLSRYKALYSKTFIGITTLAFCVCISVFGTVTFLKSVDDVKQTDNIEQTSQPVITPMPEVTPTVTPSIKVDNAVYVMPTGRVYHRENCSYVNLSKARLTTAQEAEEQGLSPCKSCNPDRQ